MNIIEYWPVSIEDIGICEKIFGTDIYKFKGKTVHIKQKSVVNDYMEITQKLKDTQQNIDLCADIMYIQGNMFLVTITKRIKFIVIQDIIDRKITILNKALDNTFRV